MQACATHRNKASSKTRTPANKRQSVGTANEATSTYVYFRAPSLIVTHVRSYSNTLSHLFLTSHLLSLTFRILFHLLPAFIHSHPPPFSGLSSFIHPRPLIHSLPSFLIRPNLPLAQDVRVNPSPLIATGHDKRPRHGAPQARLLLPDGHDLARHRLLLPLWHAH